MGKGYFITGTDTGVGKTVITAALATMLHQQGLKVGVMKPAETGCLAEGGELLPQDALFLRNASGCTASLELIAPYRLAEPLTPAIAAERMGIRIDIAHIRHCYERLLAEHDIVLVEGSGGLLAPLTNQFTMQDIAIELCLPIFIVARNVLGTINHTALTVSVAQQRCSVLGVIVNHTEPPDPSDLAKQTNEQALKRWVETPIYCQLPYLSTITNESLLALGKLLATDALVDAMGLTTPGLSSLHSVEREGYL
jgi:dethiobiotin synthetase